VKPKLQPSARIPNSVALAPASLTTMVARKLTIDLAPSTIPAGCANRTLEIGRLDVFLWPRDSVPSSANSIALTLTLGSGRADTRPDFQGLVEDAMAGRFDCVLIYHSSRFARARPMRSSASDSCDATSASTSFVTQPLGGDADDPAAFLTESVHEIFDEYYSVCLSFCVKMGLKEKAWQRLAHRQPLPCSRSGIHR
jgi:hypothetical protein